MVMLGSWGVGGQVMAAYRLVYGFGTWRLTTEDRHQSINQSINQ